MKFVMLYTAAAALLAAPPAWASDKRVTQTSRYRAMYVPDRDTYCIRFYSDSQVADPRPGGPGITCRSRQAWAKERVFISDRHKDTARPRQ